VSQQINLFNPIFLKQKKYFSAVTMAQALGLIMLGVAALSAYAGYRLFELKKEAAATTAQLAQTQAQLEKLKATFAPRQRSQTLEAEIGKAEAELTTKNQALETLQNGELGNTAGYSEYLRAFARQIVPGIWLTGFTIHAAGKDIAIRGRATQPEMVPNYLGRLKRETTMQGKSFSTFEMHRPAGEQAKAGNGASAAPAAAPGFVEFRLSSAGIAEDGATNASGK
jgi:hypothetical protein